MKKMLTKKKIGIYSLIITVTYLFTSFSITPYYENVNAATYSFGSRGSTVRQIQTRLKRWDYYKGRVDGKYGYRTYRAVKTFQRKNRIKANGVADIRTLAALGINESKAVLGSRSTKRGSGNQNVMLLARLINGEARGEPYEGQVAVGAVVMNRTKDPRFPKTIAGVIYQPGAFTATVDGQINANILQSSINAARDAVNGWDPSGGAVYYFNAAKTTNKWIWSRPLIKRIGKHRFCK